MRHHRGIILSLLLVAATQAQAADVADVDENIIVLGRLLDEAPASPAYGSILLDRARIANDASGRLENLLGQVAGFQQFRRSDSRSANPSAQGATLRALGGNASSRTLVLLDAVPMADPFFGYIPFSALVPNQLQSVRVTRGGGNGAFGAGAVAGTIELNSASRQDQAYHFLQAAYGSYDSFLLNGEIAPDIGPGFAVLSFRWDKGDGFNTTPESQRTAATVPARYESTSISLRGVMPLNETTEIQWRGLIFEDARTLRFAGADNGSQGEDAHLRIIHKGDWQWDILGYVQYRNFNNVVVSATSFRPTLNQYDTPSRGYGAKLEIRPPVGEAHVLRLGADMRGAHGEMFEESYNAMSGAITARRHAGGNQISTGFFIEDDWTLGRLIVTAGSRLDYWRITQGFFETTPNITTAPTRTRYPARDGWETSVRAGLLWKATDSWQLRAVGYTGFRLPTLNELYRPFTVFPVTTRANADLTREKLQGADIGVTYLLPRGRLSVGVFSNTLKDAIANVTIGDNLRQRQNVDAIKARGVEVDGDYQVENWRLAFSYAYAHSRVKAPGQAFDDLVPAQSPAHMASATLAYAQGQAWQWATTARYVAKQNEDDVGRDVLQSALTMDMVAQLGLKAGWSLEVRGENIWNAKVMTRNAAGSIDYGTPRILWLSLRYQK